MNQKQSGFTLIELSIVLVIIGLIIGGTLIGNSLISQAKLKSVLADLRNYSAAIHAFDAKYGAIPGDMDDATRFWDGVYDGNGDGEVVGNNGGNSPNEPFMFWQHLAKAKMIDGFYTGLSGPANKDDSEVGDNVPGSKYAGAGWTARTCDAGGCGPDDYLVDYNGHLTFGLKNPVYQTDMDYKVLTPLEAYSIDKKLDDGLPATGFVIALFYNDECASANDGTSQPDDFDASYRIDDTNVECALVFRDLF